MTESMPLRGRLVLKVLILLAFALPFVVQAKQSTDAAWARYSRS